MEHKSITRSSSIASGEWPSCSIFMRYSEACGKSFEAIIASIMSRNVSKEGVTFAPARLSTTS